MTKLYCVVSKNNLETPLRKYNDLLITPEKWRANVWIQDLSEVMPDINFEVRECKLVFND